MLINILVLRPSRSLKGQYPLKEKTLIPEKCSLDYRKQSQCCRCIRSYVEYVLSEFCSIIPSALY